MDKLINDFKISYTKGDTYALAIKFKSLTEDLRTAFFTVKENPDDEPLLQKSLGAGIDKIDDRAYKNEKTYKLQIQADDTANLEAHVQYLYDLQVTVGNVVKTVISGVFVVTHSLSANASAFGSTLEVEIDDTLETEVFTTPATKGIEYETDPVANAKIGDLKALETTSKETLVKAINEAKNDAKTNANNINSVDSKATTNASNISQILNGGKTVSKATTATNANYATSAGSATSATKATTADNYSSGGGIDTALKGKANSTHSHSEYLKKTDNSQTITGNLKVTGDVECNVKGTINDVEIWEDENEQNEYFKILKNFDWTIPYKVPLMPETSVSISSTQETLLHTLNRSTGKITLEINIQNMETKKITVDLDYVKQYAQSTPAWFIMSVDSTALFSFIYLKFSGNSIYINKYQRTNSTISRSGGTYTISINEIIE